MLGSPHYHLERWLGGLSVDEGKVRRLLAREDSHRQRCNRAAVAIVQRHIKLTVCPYGRVHTVVTRLKGRSAQGMGGRAGPFVEIDVANAQPLIAGLAAGYLHRGLMTLGPMMELAQPTYESSNERRKAKRRAKTKNKAKHNHTCGRNSGYHYPELGGDLMDYLEVCRRGEFYETLAGLWGFDVGDARQRDEFQKACYRLLFFGPTRHHDARWIAFRSRWPTVAWFLERIKADDYRLAAQSGSPKGWRAAS